MSRNLKVCLDSRLIQPGDYFVPIVGENFDGHTYIQKAIENGAAGVIEEEQLYKETVKKLNKIKPKIIGVTGSSGKSTTTKLLHTVLSSQFNTCLGSLNTKLGLSVEVVNTMEENCQLFVAEMGMDKLGELKDTTTLFPPDFAVLTTINHVHVEKLGSMKNLVKAKGEILQGLKKDGIALINKENQYTRSLGENHQGKVIWFDSTPLLKYPNTFVGDFNIRNANVCTIIARSFGMTDENIIRGLKKFRLPKGRLNMLEGINGTQLIDDTYNANPESVIYALEILNNKTGKRKIAILGDMRELGRFSKKDHKKVAEQINELNIDVFIGVGKLAKLICENVNATKSKVLWIEDAEQFSTLLKNTDIKLKENDVVLIKGSQGQRMEKIVKVLLKDQNKASQLLVRQDARWN